MVVGFSVPLYLLHGAFNFVFMIKTTVHYHTYFNYT